MPSRCSNQCWYIVICILRNKLRWNFNRNFTFSLKKIHLNMSSARWRPFSLTLNALSHLFYETPHASLLDTTCIIDVAKSRIGTSWALHGHDDVIKWKISSKLFASCHKGQWRGALMFSLMCTWTNGWANSPDTGELRRHARHCYTSVMATYWNIPLSLATTLSFI